MHMRQPRYQAVLSRRTHGPKLAAGSDQASAELAEAGARSHLHREMPRWSKPGVESRMSPSS